jgi:hypothetical protein
VVPSQLEPATGDVREGPSVNITDNAVVQIFHVLSESPIHQSVDVYTTKDEHSDIRTLPFIHPVELKGEKGIPANVNGLFDDGALVNSICKTVFPVLRNTLGALTPSSKTSRMADGTRVPSQGCWSGSRPCYFSTLKYSNYHKY